MPYLLLNNASKVLLCIVQFKSFLSYSYCEYLVLLPCKLF